MSKDDLSLLKQVSFNEAIKQLEDLISQNNRAFLLGAGCSRCAGLPLTSDLTKEVLESKTLTGVTKEIFLSIQKQFDGSATATIEDYMSELVDLLTITERRSERGANCKIIDLGGKQYTEDVLRKALDEIKNTIANCIDTKKVDIATHRQFVTAVHRILQSGKTNNAIPADYFVLNYDTLIEDALALECLSYSDGFSGGTTAWWDITTFDKNNIIARILKIHGSIDWCELEADMVPRRIRLSGDAFSGVVPQKKVIIWPASTKYQETQKDPYAQIMAIMRKTLRPGLRSEIILVVCGYRFNDSHINVEIDHALHESEGRLTVLIFTEFEAPVGQIEKWHKDLSVTEQVRIYAKRGFFHGSNIIKSDKDLPWWKFENLVRILGGER